MPRRKEPTTLAVSIAIPQYGAHQTGAALYCIAARCLSRKQSYKEHRAITGSKCKRGLVRCCALGLGSTTYSAVEVLVSNPVEKESPASAPDSPPETICRTTKFVREHTGWMLRTATGIVADRQTAEDVVQESFVKIFNKADQFSGIAPLRRWMYRIVVNQALMAIRKRKRIQQKEAAAAGPEFDANGCRIEGEWSNLETPETILRSSQKRDQVLSAIMTLPEKYRLVLLLRDIEELTTLETAQILGISEANVKVRLHRGRSSLKSILEPLLRGTE